MLVQLSLEIHKNFFFYTELNSLHKWSHNSEHSSNITLYRVSFICIYFLLHEMLMFVYIFCCSNIM